MMQRKPKTFWPRHTANIRVATDEYGYYRAFVWREHEKGLWWGVSGLGFGRYVREFRGRLKNVKAAINEHLEAIAEGRL